MSALQRPFSPDLELWLAWQADVADLDDEAGVEMIAAALSTLLEHALAREEESA